MFAQTGEKVGKKSESVALSDLSRREGEHRGPIPEAGGASWAFAKVPISPPGAGVHARLAVGREDDPSEEEAERTAEKVVASDGFSPEGIRPTSPKKEKGAPGEKGRPLNVADREFFEPRLGRSLAEVRVHDDAEANVASQAMGARAYTLGNDIAFAEGEYAPSTPTGRRLLAHELAHVVQGEGREGSQVVRRDIAEADIGKTPVTQIMADANYFENGITRISFYGAQMARLFYGDGKQLDIGLVPGEIHPPVQAVDYHTVRSTHMILNPTGGGQQVGSIDFLPRGTLTSTKGNPSAGQVVAATKRTINFTHESGSGRIVPSEVNSISAPRLCEALRGAEDEYKRNTDAIAKGMVKALTVLNYALMIYSVVDAAVSVAGRAGSAVEGAGETGAAAAGAATRAQSTLTSLFVRLLRTGTAETITVEGVGLSGVRSTLRGAELIVERDAIVNASRIAGQGRLVNGAFEQAAIAAARQAGATTARVAYHTVVNAEWSAYLESLGYSYEVMEGTTAGSIITKVLTKAFTL